MYNNYLISWWFTIVLKLLSFLLKLLFQFSLNVKAYFKIKGIISNTKEIESIKVIKNVYR